MDDGPLGRAWGLGPDGLTFDTPAIATIELAMEGSGLVTDEGWILV